MNDRFAKTPSPHYYAVIFSNQLSDDDTGYAEMGARMFELAMEHPGCLGAETTRDKSGFGITVSYWDDEASIADWKANAKHLAAQAMGIERWYAHYELRVARIERAYSGPKGRSAG
ncbi:antibiotic biosynthesis monooxygenase [Aliisedimentitalea sp. MJ-SS2]|uniref:antibiotic biosynthesis monooxygenase family protein n=1 Tax=Aliisedimentitalea sp. MJ-SS2 TaxID=3049795 RepID=UPI0029303097|nr:antibiotic biosynthesis monooxygenase [Alisedimentitalea sp. MJ-SS2]